MEENILYIKMYARLKEDLGNQLIVPNTFETIQDLRQYLIDLFPALSSTLLGCRFAVDDAIVALEYRLHGVRHVSIIPPSSGG